MNLCNSFLTEPPNAGQNPLNKISCAAVIMPLPAPASVFAFLISVDQNHRRDNQYCRRYETEWFQGIPEPVKRQNITESHGNSRQNDDEERAVHRKGSR